MSSTARAPAALAGRLERLTGEAADCCLPGYREIANKVRRTPRFGSALDRARAMADPARLLAMALLRRRGELCACEVQAATGVSHATVSHHMGVLVRAQLVRGRRSGKWTYYRLSEQGRSVAP